MAELYNQLTKEPMNFMMIDLIKRRIKKNICDIVVEL
jgi:hypothetical protein